MAPGTRRPSDTYDRTGGGILLTMLMLLIAGLVVSGRGVVVVLAVAVVIGLIARIQRPLLAARLRERRAEPPRK
jgi:O-antigen ligase